MRIPPPTEGGLLKRCLNGVTPSRGPNPFHFIYHFWQKMYPFHTLSIENYTAFTYLQNSILNKNRYARRTDGILAGIWLTQWSLQPEKYNICIYQMMFDAMFEF